MRPAGRLRSVSGFGLLNDEQHFLVVNRENSLDTNAPPSYKRQSMRESETLCEGQLRSYLMDSADSSDQAPMPDKHASPGMESAETVTPPPRH